jgi:hypothetical protein
MVTIIKSNYEFSRILADLLYPQIGHLFFKPVRVDDNGLMTEVLRARKKFFWIIHFDKFLEFLIVILPNAVPKLGTSMMVVIDTA